MESRLHGGTGSTTAMLPGMAGTIVCDVTDPLAGRSAAEFATAIGARLGLRIVFVSVAAGPRPELAHDAELRIVPGDHAEVVARVAAEEGADLLVVGGRPAGLGGRNLRWRLARELEAATPVPVLVAPPSTRTRSRRRLAAAASNPR
jgi:nucleotide-binding universal stress UspA family protein